MKRVKKEEQVLLYNFHDADTLEQFKDVLKPLHIRVTVLKDDDYAEKIGFLLSVKGYQPAKEKGEAFTFSGEVMILHNIQGKRLDEVLRFMKEAGLPRIHYKAVVTPFNILWTLRRLCETMRKEHGEITKAKRTEEDTD